MTKSEKEPLNLPVLGKKPKLAMSLAGPQIPKQGRKSQEELLANATKLEPQGKMTTKSKGIKEWVIRR